MTTNIEKHYHDDIYCQINKFIDNNNLPHILLHGNQGSGKKTIISNTINKLYRHIPEKDKSLYLMYENCGHGKGIKFVRDNIKFFAKTNINCRDGTFKCVVLLNADKLTMEAQSALRRCIELFSHSTRFFISVQDKNKMLSPILSRFCTIYVPSINSRNLHFQSIPCIELMKNETRGKKSWVTKTINNCLSNEDVDMFTMVDTIYQKGVNYNDVLCFLQTKLKRDSYNHRVILDLIYNITQTRCEYRNDKLFLLNILIQLKTNSFKI